MEADIQDGIDYLRMMAGKPRRWISFCSAGFETQSGCNLASKER
jgi:hypothetical protein